MKNTKKGFTLVELLVVIAILAILATVAVVGYTSFMDKANLSVDQQAVEQLNTALEAGSVGLKADEITIQNVDTILAGAGFNMENGVNALRSGNRIYWFKTYNTIVLADKNGVVVFPTDNAKLIEEFKANFTDTSKVFDLAKLVEGSSVVVGGEVVNSLAEALEKGGEVTLFGDVAIKSAVSITKDTVINLNGHNIETAQSIGRPFEVKEDGAKLTINAEGATIQTGKWGLVDITGSSDNVEVVINGGTFEGSFDNGSLIKVRSGALDGVRNVEVVLNNVNVNITETNPAGKSFILNAAGNATGSVNVNVKINGGTYNVPWGFNMCDNVEIKNATINATAGTAIVQCNAVIEDSTLTSAIAGSTNFGCISAAFGTEITINNSTIKAPNGYALRVLNSGGTIVAEGCTLEGEYGVMDISEDGASGSITINGTVVDSKTK